jgi:uncharacterized membrane protein YhfC
VDLLFITHLLNGLLMMAMPVGLAIVLTRRWALGWRLVLVGGATFVLSQAGHVPFNLLMGSLLNRTSLVDLSPAGQRVFNAVFLGLSAGLFEELFRAGMFRWWLRDARSWRKGVLAGVGHGGTEAILLGGLSLFAFAQLAALRGADLAALLPPDQAAEVQRQMAAYWSMAWPESLLGALERLFTLPIQIALAVLVLQAFTRRQWGWIALAVGYHALVDAAAVLALPTLGVIATEALVGGFAVVSLAIILALREPEPAPAPEPAPPAPSPGIVAPPPVEASPEALDDTRYVEG